MGENVQFIFSGVPGLRVVMDNLSGEGSSSERQHDSALPLPYLQGNALLYFKQQVILLVAGTSFLTHSFLKESGLQKDIHKQNVIKLFNKLDLVTAHTPPPFS